MWIEIFRGKKGKFHIYTTPSVECLAATHIDFRELKGPVFVDEEESKETGRLYTMYPNENISWHHEEICGSCSRTLVKNIKLGYWPQPIS
jgi:hypothetical protein